MRVRTTVANIVAAIALASGVPFAAAQTDPEPPDGADQANSPAGHGEISIDYFDSYASDFLLRSNLKLSSVTHIPFGAVHLQGTGLDASYNLNNDWTISGGIRYFTGRYDGPLVNCPTTAPPQCAHAPVQTPPQPQAPFIDDGRYHGAWQDWHFGIAWHKNIEGYIITPSATAYIPTHDYPTYGNAVVGQDLRQLLLAIQLQHQFDFTDFYYSVDYGYALSQHVLNVDTGYQRADLEVGWFATPKLKLDVFLTGRAGFGLRAPPGSPGPGDPVDEGWFERQRITQHDYRAGGVGFKYDIGDRYSVSADVQHEYWGDSVYNFKYAVEAYVTRSF